MSNLYRLATCSIRGRLALEKVVSPAALVCSRSFHQEIQTYKSNEQTSVSAPLNNYVSQCNYATKKVFKKKSKKDSSSSSSDSSDSDADKKNVKKRRGQSNFWRRKMRTHHMVIDINKDGVVSWDDFEVFIKNFSKLGNLTPKELEQLADSFKHVWEEEWGAGGDPYAFVGQEEFLSTMERALNTKDLRKKIASPLPYIFKAVDWDNSGEISIEEFKTFFKCLGLTEEAAREAFAAIDLNGDGRLSQKEFVRIGRDFFITENENDPSKLFWGPLCQ